MAVAWRAHQD